MNREGVDKWTDTRRDLIADAIVSADPTDFAALLHATPGLPPEDAYQALLDLQTHPAVAAKADLLITSAGSIVDQFADPLDHVLLPPHPLDHEWRFNVQTRQSLADRLVARAGADGHVLALGCPTVIYELLSSPTGPRMTLVDVNPGLAELSSIERYTQIKADLRLVTPGQIRPADVCLADPPFYPDYMHAFITTAAALLSRDGTLLLVMPAPATRPTARGDVDTAIEYATRCGLRHVGVQPGAVTYHRPQFERNAHEVLGLHGVPDDWRIADVHEFVRVAEPSTPPLLEPRDFPLWEEVILGSNRIRVRTDQPDLDLMRDDEPLDGELLEEIVTGGVLDSVSGREPRRALANVWTDANVVWCTRRPTLLLAILRSAAEGSDPTGTAIAHCEAAGIEADHGYLASMVGEVLGKVSPNH